MLIDDNDSNLAVVEGADRYDRPTSIEARLEQLVRHHVAPPRRCGVRRWAVGIRPHARRGGCVSHR
ncbi:hypothetical protein AB0I90_15375 [Micromonospora wenchangensis]|uniref:hypothetical protein n=1 Tax=Micromonospora wenchangensis TaxID=1185415 RepID=UPI0033CDC518